MLAIRCGILNRAHRLFRRSNITNVTLRRLSAFNDVQKPITQKSINWEIKIEEQSEPSSRAMVYMLPCFGFDADANSAVQDLFFGAENGHYENTLILLERFPDFNKLQDAYGNSVLHWAVLGGRTKIVMALIEQGANWQAKNNSGMTPLCIAAAHNRLDIVAILTAVGSNLEEPDIDGAKPMHYATSYSSARALRALNVLGAEIEGRTNTGLTPLMRTGDVQCTEYLLSAGASVYSTCNLGYTPLHHVNCVKSVEALIEAGAEIDAKPADFVTPVGMVARVGGENANLGLITLLARLGANVGLDPDAVSIDDHSGNPLAIAVMNGHVDAAVALIQQGADVNVVLPEGITMLHIAAYYGQVNMIHTLIHFGAKIDSITEEGRTPLVAAAINVRPGAVWALVQNGADINHETEINGNTKSCYPALFCVLEDPELTAELLAMGANLHHKSKIDAMKTALHRAAERGLPETVKVLLDAGADVNATDNTGGSALHYAMTEECARLLLEYGADMDVVDNQKFSPLSWAIEGRNLPVVKVFVEAGILDRPLAQGVMPYGLFAVFKKAPELVRYFMSQSPGLDPNAMWGKNTALMLAVPHAETMRLLLDNGARVDSANELGNTAMHMLLNNRGCTVEMMRALVEAGGRIDVPNQDGITPFDACLSMWTQDFLQGAFMTPQSQGVEEVEWEEDAEESKEESKEESTEEPKELKEELKESKQ